MAELGNIDALKIAAAYFKGEHLLDKSNNVDDSIENLFDMAEKIQAEYKKRYGLKPFNKDKFGSVL